MNSRNLLLSAFACLALALVAAGCATPTTGGPACGAGQVACNGSCVNAQTDNQNCGACGTTCGTGKSCQAGACKCGAGLLDCGGTCLPSSSSNCGMCGKTCSGTQVCANGTCANSCAAGQMQCAGGTCANLLTRLGQLRHLRQHVRRARPATTAAAAVRWPVRCFATTLRRHAQQPHQLRWLQPTVHGHLLERRLHGDDGRRAARAAVRRARAAAAGAGGGGSGPAGRAAARPVAAGATGVAGTTGTGGARSCAIMPPPGRHGADVISDFEEGYGVMIQQGGRTGYWSPYNNTGRPAEPDAARSRPVAMADKIAVDAAAARAHEQRVPRRRRPGRTTTSASARSSTRTCR